MQPARALHLFEFFADFCDALADQPPVGFDLRFARTAEEAEAAALALQVGPASHEPAALIGQMREFDLQAAFPRLRALAEDFEDQRRAVEHLRAPRLFQIALLDGRKLRVDDDHFGLERRDLRGDLFDLAAADQCRGHWAARAARSLARRPRRPMAAVSPTASARRASASRSEMFVGAPRRLGLYVNDERRATLRVAMPLSCLRLRRVSSAAGSIFLQLDRTQRHDGRDRVLVDELRLPVPAQKNAEIVEPSDVP